MTPFDPSHLYRASDVMAASSNAASFPKWVHAAFGEFAAVMKDAEFPCTFAREAFNKDSLLFLFPGRAEDAVAFHHFKQGLLDYLDRLTVMSRFAAAMTVLNVMWQPEPRTLSLPEYQRAFWQLLQRLHDDDEQPWPADIPTDPEQPGWSFCFAGVPLFINLNCPAHDLRRSRRVCPTMAMVINPHDSFDVIAGANERGDKIRGHIRSLIQKYDGQPAAPELDSYGRESNREWRQYALPDDNSDRIDRCPLVIRRLHIDSAERR